MARPDTDTLTAIAGPCEAADRAQLAPLLRAIRDRHEPAVLGLIYYGSCFRRADPHSGLVDFYVIVDDFRTAGLGAAAANACRLLPPNVYYLEAGDDRTKLACKYAVISESQLTAGVTRWFCASLWGRLAQPVAIVHARDTAARGRLRAACGQAVITLLERALPALGSGSAPPARWFGQALSRSFASELRVEGAARVDAFIGDRVDEYERRFRAAAPWLTLPTTPGPDGRITLHVDPTETHRARIRWTVRGWHGRLLSIVRLAKACFTFDGAIDYGAWKVERHTGHRPAVSARVRRHPVLFGWPLLIRAVRAGRRDRPDRGD